ncbi:hypothetical protein [Paracoccus alkenifer]|uniref:Uncharacterized protein n=1 Tax=Paracoccus alkenifer TaxID=65735 RepID=A0A1H6N6D3_9RHOB|nr:hypothetical protein [Paracoccus alkenifer]SEI10251.1 hypothetical protein SAMN04488075_2884 [Paracoccus alkenifer]
MSPPITAGLLWSTDVAIDFAASGPIVPAIPMPRAAGPLYCVVSAQTAGSEGVIFRVGNPDDNFHEQNTFQAERWDGLYGLMAAPGWPNQVIGEAPAISATANHLWEFWFSTAGTDFIDHQPFGFVNNDLPNQDVAASSHLFIGYRLNDGTPMDRATGTIHRMAFYDRVPTEAERALLATWVNGGFPLVAGDFWHYRQEDVTTAGVDTAHGLSMPLDLTGALARATVAGVEWMDCAAGVLSGTHSAWSASAGLAVWVLADGSRPAGTAIYNGVASAVLNDNQHLNFHGDGLFRTTNNTTRTATWPVPAAAGPETFCWTAAAGTTAISGYSLRHNGVDLGGAALTDPSRNAARSGTNFIIGGGSNLAPGGLRWRDVVIKIGADFTPQEVAALEVYAAERVQSQGDPPITMALAASDAPDTARITASVRWPAIAASMAAADAPDSASISATVPVRASLAAADAPDRPAIRATVGWPAIMARIAASDAPDTAAMSLAVRIGATLSASDAPDIARIIAGTGWPAIMARVAASDAPDQAAIQAAVPIRAGLAAGDAPDSARLSVAVRIGATLSASDAPDMASIIMRLWSQTSRYAYPGDPQGGTLAPSIRSGTIQRP